MLNEYYQRSLQVPEGLEELDLVLRESFSCYEDWRRYGVRR